MQNNLDNNHHNGSSHNLPPPATILYVWLVLTADIKHVFKIAKNNSPKWFSGGWEGKGRERGSEKYAYEKIYYINTCYCSSKCRTSGTISFLSAVCDFNVASQVNI